MNMHRLSMLLDLRMDIQRLQQLRENIDTSIDQWAENYFRLYPMAQQATSVLSDASRAQIKAMVKRDIEERLGPLLREFEEA